MAALQRNGVMAVLIPCLLPPPAPFKIFILLAGVAGISAARLAIGDRDRPRHPLPRARHPGGQVRRPRDGYMRENGTSGLAGGRRRAGRRLRALSPVEQSAAPERPIIVYDRLAADDLSCPSSSRSGTRPRRCRAPSRVHRDAGGVGTLVRDHRRRRRQHGRELRDPGAAAGGRSAPARDPLPPQLRPDRGLCRRLCARPRPADRHLGRRSAERSARHSDDGASGSRAATTSCAAGARIARTPSCRAACRRRWPTR